MKFHWQRKLFFFNEILFNKSCILFFRWSRLFLLHYIIYNCVLIISYGFYLTDQIFYNCDTFFNKPKHFIVLEKKLMKNLWNYLPMKILLYPIYEFFIHEMSYLWIFYPWNVLSMNFLSMKCPFYEFFIYEMSYPLCNVPNTKIRKI